MVSNATCLCAILLRAGVAALAWKKFAQKHAPDYPPIKNTAKWAAALEYWVLEHAQKRVTKSMVCRKYGITISVLNKCLQRLCEALEEEV